MSQYYILDRFEDNGWAVLESPDGQTFDVPQAWLPEDVREGDSLRFIQARSAEQSTLILQRDPEHSEERRQAAKELRDSIPKAPSGDFDL